VDLEIGRIGPAEDLRPVLALRPAGAVFFDLGQRADVIERSARLGKARKILQRYLRRVHKLYFPARAALEGFARRGPDVVYGFSCVVRAPLPLGCNRYEEARVEAP
jgi:hypothetical protein